MFIFLKRLTNGKLVLSSEMIINKTEWSNIKWNKREFTPLITSLKI